MLKREIKQNSLTKLIIFVCFINLVVSFFINNNRFDFTIDLGPSVDTLNMMGAKYTDKIINHWEIHRLMWPTFLHTGIIHFITNTIVLYYLGTILETEYGSIKIFIIFLLSSLFGWLLSSIFLINTLGVGASGGIFGLIGGYIIHLLKQNRFSALVIYGFFINLLLTIFFGTLPIIDNWAHLGGLISGILLGFICFISKHYKIRLGISIFLMIVFIMGVYVLFNLPLGPDLCKNCLFLNCFETPWWDCRCKARFTNGNIIDIPC